MIEPKKILNELHESLSGLDFDGHVGDDGNRLVVPGTLVVEFVGGTVRVFKWTMKWTSPSTTAPDPKLLGCLSLDVFGDSHSELLACLQTLAISARDVRQAEHQKCNQCHEQIPPERWENRYSMCMSCAGAAFNLLF